MATGYRATVYVQSGGIGHAFIRLEAPGQPPITVGYYPVETSPAGPGMVVNDAISGPEDRITKLPTQHPGDPVKTFDISPSQYAAMVNQVAWVANHPGTYGVANNQCTGFVVDTLNAGGINVAAGAHPTSLNLVLPGLPNDQSRDLANGFSASQVSENITGIYQGIAAHNPSDPGHAAIINDRIAPVGTVVVGDDTSNTNTSGTSTAGAGRGNVNPDPVDPTPSTVFNPATALSNSNGEYTVTVQAGDTVSSIAARLGMSVQDYSDFLRGQYGAGADLNSIVAGRQLPIPREVYENLHPINGLDLPDVPAAPNTTNTDSTDPRSRDVVNGSDQQSDATTPNTPTPDTLGTGPGSTGDTLNNDSLQNPTYGGGDVDTPIISDDGYDPGTYIDSHDPTDVHSGADNINGLDLPADYQMPITDRDAQQANNALNLFNTLVNGLQNWDNASDLARIQTAVTLYNQLNSLNGMNMPNMGGVGAGLSLYSAIQNGDYGGMVVSGVQLGNALSSSGMGVSQAIADTAIAQAIGLEAAQVVPVLGLIVSLVHAEENPLGVVIAAVSIACPVCGIFLAFAQIIATKSPVSVGEASATFDEAGNLIVNTDEDKNGGGSTANKWMQQLAHGAQLAGLQTPLAGAFAAGMPSVGYRYAPDELNNIDKDGKPINGYLTLNWTGQDGKAYSRHYLGNGESAGWGDMGDEGSMAEDFFELMQSSFELYPPLMYEQLDGGVLQLDYGVATLVHATNTQKYNGQAEHTHGGEEETDAAQDQAITIEAGDKRLVQDNSQTVQNQSKQTHATVAASSLHTVDNASEQCYVFDSKLGNQYDGYMPKKLIKIALSNHIAANDGAYQIIA
jgi:hypothetical protein